jgi:hypothetical protein
MSTAYNLPKKLLEQVRNDFGKNPALWPEELRDLINPTIEARSIAPPESGKVEKFINTDYHYYWAKDICGQTPNHERVAALRWAGWDYASTDDVQMCSEDTVVGRSKDKKSKDGKGWSDEIRSGDRRLMKIPMRRWKESRKAQNIAALQLAYPQPYGENGNPMTAENLIPGLHSGELDANAIEHARSSSIVSNPGEDLAEVLKGGEPKGNAAISKIGSRGA